MIGRCRCNHEDQDHLYGRGRRLMNDCKPKIKDPKHYRCTVCGSVWTDNDLNQRDRRV